MPEHTIVCLSSQRWDEKMWTNKQHVMSRLAKDHRVIHVDFGLRPLPVYLYRRAQKRPMDLLHPARLLSDGVVHRGGNLYVADSYVPYGTKLLPQTHPVRDFLTYDWKVMLLQRFLREHRIEDPIVWVYHPGFADAVDRLPRKLLVYDCVDNYAAFPEYAPVADWILERERRLCRKADLVFTTSAPLFEKRRAENPENTFLVHNVGDADHFKKAMDPDLQVAPEIARLSGPVIGFIGAVSDYKLNAEWLLALAVEHPEWNIVLIGPVGLSDPSTDVSRLRAQPNVHLLGVRDYADLPRYLKGMHVTVIPYRINAYTESVFPIKFFEMLATGKPVVVSSLPSLRDYFDAVRVAETAEEFVARCEEALRDPDTGREQRVLLAEKYSWPHRIGQMMGHVERKLGELQRGSRARS
jgi:glycosyltransferase involved in cell wall biosynthesis